MLAPVTLDEPLRRELRAFQRSIVSARLKVLWIFEGLDAAGKTATIDAIRAGLDPGTCRVVALAKPTARERAQWYFQRYLSCLPAEGELVLFDRSWYNRGGLERVMGFCSEVEAREFLARVPELEGLLVRSGIVLGKVWLSVSPAEQARRLSRRVAPTPVDLAAPALRRAYDRAAADVLALTSTRDAPWTVVPADDLGAACSVSVRALLAHSTHERRIP